MTRICPHGLVGSCPDCRPGTLTVGDVYGAPHAIATGHIVRRTKPDGSHDWFTSHLTKWGARRAAARYMRDGKVKGFRT